MGEVTGVSRVGLKSMIGDLINHGLKAMVTYEYVKRALAQALSRSKKLPLIIPPYQRIFHNHHFHFHRIDRPLLGINNFASWLYQNSIG